MKKNLFLIIAILGLLVAEKKDLKAQYYNPSGYIAQTDTLGAYDTLEVTAIFSRYGNLFSIENQVNITKINPTASYSMYYETWKTLDGSNYVKQSSVLQSANSYIHTNDTCLYCKQLKFLYFNDQEDSITIDHYIVPDKLFGK